MQTLAGNEAFRIKETTYVADYLSRPNNDLMSFEKGGVTTRTTYGRGHELLGQKVMPGAESTTPAQMMHFQSDIWGSPLLAVGEQGGLQHYAERNIWGDLKIGVHGNSDLAGFEDSFRFSSYGYDSVIGKHFAYARFYDSSQGRMLAKDPIKRGLNPYLYCDNDPVDYVDPVGETPTMLLGAGLGALVGGLTGFAGSAISQLASGEEFNLRKAAGSAANGAVVGLVQGSLVGSSVGIPAAFAANFGAGAVGNALEQGISKGSVDIRESITSGLTNAVAGTIYGTKELTGLKNAVFRGAGAGGATAGINNISSALGIRNAVYADAAETDYSGRFASGWTVSSGRRRNPRTLCGGSNPFEKSLGYQTAYGYQYGTSQTSSSTSKTRKRKGFSFKDFAKDVLIGMVTGGLASAVFYGAGKAVDVLKGSVQSGKIPVKTDFYVKPGGEIVPAIGYRYMSKDASYLPSLKNTMEIPANPSGTYITFDRFDIPSPGRLQVPHDASVRGSFDTLQIIDDISVPNGKWGQASWLEPITKDFPKYGPGGATQAITHQKIKLSSLKDLL